jgi:hypothetical protein
MTRWNQSSSEDDFILLISSNSQAKLTKFELTGWRWQITVIHVPGPGKFTWQVYYNPKAISQDLQNRIR